MYDRTTDDMKINNYDVDNLTEIDFCDMGSVKSFVVNHVNPNKCGLSVKCVWWVGLQSSLKRVIITSRWINNDRTILIYDYGFSIFYSK